MFEKLKDQNRLEKARNLMESRLPIEQLRKIKKYRKITLEQYLILMDKLAFIAINTIEIAILANNKT
jgi:hypothetical protein